VTNAAARIVHVAAIPRDHVHVEVRHRLPSGRACVEPDVVAVRMQLIIELLLDRLDQLEDRRALFGARGEPVRDDPARDHERVSLRHGVAIADGKRQRVVSDPVGDGNLEKDAQPR